MTISKHRDERKNGRKQEKRIKSKRFFAITKEMRYSEAYKCLSSNAVNILIEMHLKSDEPWDWASYEIITITHKEVKDKIKGRNQFYAARQELVEYGFFEEVNDGIPKDPKKKGLGHQKTKFRKDIKWQSISSVLKDEKDRAAHSEKMKKRFKDSGLEEPKDFLDEL